MSSISGTSNNQLVTYSDENPFPIEYLPMALLGKIFSRIATETGTKDILNERDIPVAMRYMNSFSLTCKRINECAKNPAITRLCFIALGKKYNKAPEECAAQLNTLSTRKFLWKVIEEKEYDKAYKAIQAIHQLAHTVAKEAKEAGDNFDFSIRKPHPDPCCPQTQSGFFLYCGNLQLNDIAIATPFGKVPIFDGSSIFTRYSAFSISEVFIKRMNASFEKLSFRLNDSRNRQIYEILHSDSKLVKIRKIVANDLIPLNEVDLDDKKGTKNLIVSLDLCVFHGTSVYKLQRVGEEMLPEAKFLDPTDDTKSCELVKRIWEMLERKNIGKNPLEEPERVEIECPPRVGEKLDFRDLAEFSSWSINLIKEASNQPILQLHAANTAQALQVLINAAPKYLEKDFRWIIDEIVDEQCHFDQLKRAFDSVLEKIGHHWEPSTLREYPGILHRESEEDYALFIKKTDSFIESTRLINFLATPFGISNFITCDDSWKMKAWGVPRCFDPYLWIRKDKLAEVTNALQLKNP